MNCFINELSLNSKISSLIDIRRDILMALLRDSYCVLFIYLLLKSVLCAAENFVCCVLFYTVALIGI